MALRGGHINGAKFTRTDSQLLGLEAPENRTDESAFDTIRFDNDESSVHDVRI